MQEDSQIEAEETKTTENAGKRRRIWLYALISVVSIFLLLLIIQVVQSTRRASWQSRAMPDIRVAEREACLSRAEGALQSIGSAQHDYRRSNEPGVYGSFKELQDAGHIAEGYTLSNMIESYSMTWEVNHGPTGRIDEFGIPVRSTFTIIAWPQVADDRWLHTFAITDDQIVREYNPDENDLESVRKWNPIP